MIFVVAVAKSCETKGYRILEAQNGSQALELAEHHTGSIEVLVTDVIMPQIRGFEIGQAHDRTSH
jgi:CheY-like chemotaxis protein